MNYYIQGDAAKANQIMAALRAKGISNGGNSFTHKEYLYFTEGGETDFCGITGHIANVIKSHPDYKELELPVEPMFKIGDWVVRGRGFVYEPSLITEIRDYYICELLNGERVTYTLNDVHKNFHLWAISDARDGDVLATDNGWTCIFKAFDGCGFSSYCFMDSQRWFCESGSEAHTPDSRINGNIHPATKEQRDLLFAKMREAGYEWDEKKKELRKIQPHYDIANFHAGMPVLVRDYDNSRWSYVQFSHYVGKECGFKFNACGIPYIQCIPFNKETEHLLGTTDMCDECYVNW